MSIHELSSPIYVYVVPKKVDGRALAWVDYGPDSPFLWLVALENKEVWLVKNEDIRMCENFSLDYK